MKGVYTFAELHALAPSQVSKKKNKHGSCIAISKTSMACQTSLSYINNDPKETMFKGKGRNKYKEKMVS